MLNGRMAAPLPRTATKAAPHLVAALEQQQRALAHALRYHVQRVGLRPARLQEGVLVSVPQAVGQAAAATERAGVASLWVPSHPSAPLQATHCCRSAFCCR